MTEYISSSHIFIDAEDLEAWSEHEMYLESFDSLLPLELQLRLRVDVIKIIIEPKACDVTQDMLNAFGAAHANDYNLFA